MNVPTRLLRRRLGLPPARSHVRVSEMEVRADDGVRLATSLLRPVAPAARRGALLVRSEHPIDHDSPLELFSRWLAEEGRTVVLQSCRGRGRSEGDFRAFTYEREDGGATIRWLRGQPWFDGRLALVGLGYSAYTAWAALAAEPEAACALVAGFGARDPYAWLHAESPRGGVLQLEAALALATRLDGRESADASRLDLARGGRFLPVCESDRVTWRELETFREWTQHPDRDAFWDERTPPLPERHLPTLQLAGWYEPGLATELADYRVLVERAEAHDAAPPALWIGPWGASLPPRRERPRGAHPLACAVRATSAFLTRVLDEGAARSAPVRVYARGGGWYESSRWPPPRSETRTLFLRSGGAANTQRGDGRLDPQPAAGDEPADVFVADPADPVLSIGGASFMPPGGPVAQDPVEWRGDVLCFTGEPLAEPLEIAGGVRARLFAAASAEAGDLAAKLVLVDAYGTARWLCEGIAPFEAASADAALEVEVDLGSAAALALPGERLRLEVAGSSVPRFARHPGTAKPRASFHGGEGRAAQRRIFHDARRPSALRIDALAIAERPTPESESESESDA